MYVEQRTNVALTGVHDEPTSSPTSGTPSEAPGLMPELDTMVCGGDPGAMLAALTMKAAHNESEVARQQRDSAERAQESAEAAEVKDLRCKADLMRIQGVLDGALQIGQGLCQLGAGLESTHAAAEKQEAANETADLKENGAYYSDGLRDDQQASIKALDDGSNHSEARSTELKSGADFAGAAEKIGDGLFQGAITDKDTDAKVHDTQAEAFKRMVEDARDDQKDAKELMQKAMEFYKEYNETRAQTMLAATHRA